MIIQASSREKREGPSLISNLLAHNSLCYGGIQLLSQSCPQATVNSPSYSPPPFSSPVIPSDLSVPIFTTVNKKARLFIERTQPAPFAIVAPLAEQAYGLVKRDCCFTHWAYVPRTGNDWKATTDHDQPLPTTTDTR